MRFLSYRSYAERDDVSISTIKRRVKSDPNHPKPIQLSPGRVGFIEEELDAYERELVAAQRAGDEAA